MKKMKRFLKVLLILIMCLVLAAVFFILRIKLYKPNVYVPAPVVSETYDSVKDFGNKINIIMAQELLPDGKCSAGEGDFVLVKGFFDWSDLQKDDYDSYDAYFEACRDAEKAFYREFAKPLASQGATVIIYSDPSPNTYEGSSGYYLATRIYETETMASEEGYGYLYVEDGANVKEIFSNLADAIQKYNTSLTPFIVSIASTTILAALFVVCLIITLIIALIQRRKKGRGSAEQ